MLRNGGGFKRVIVRCGKTDLRKGISSLVAIIRLEYNLDPLEEDTLFLFCGNKRNCIKGVCFDRDGYCMIIKRLTDGVYQWPRDSDEARALSMEEFKRLMEGFTIQSSIRVYERNTEKKFKFKPVWACSFCCQAGQSDKIYLFYCHFCIDTRYTK